MTREEDAKRENPHAGQGAVLLDIGEDVGALVVEMPRDMLGVEIEIRPVGSDDHPELSRDDHEDSEHQHDHGHDHGHGHGHGHSRHPHVAVVDRPTPAGPMPSLVYGGLQQDTYELYEKDGGPVMLTVAVRGGEVVSVEWPTL